MRIEQSAAPATQAVSDAEVSAHFATLGLTGTAAAALSLYIQAATETIERAAGLNIITRNVTLYLDAWPLSKLERQAYGLSSYSYDRFGDVPAALIDRARELAPLDLPIGPVAAGATFSVTATSEAGVDTSLPVGAFLLEPGRNASLRPLEGYTAIQDARGSRFTVTYAAGFGASSVTVPADLRLAILDQALRTYEQRGDGDASAELSGTAARIVGRYRNIRI